MEGKDFGLTEEQMIIFQWQFSFFGAFFMQLMKTISIADNENRDRIALAYPVHVSAYRLYTTQSGWWDETMRLARLAGILKEGVD